MSWLRPSRAVEQLSRAWYRSAEFMPWTSPMKTLLASLALFVPIAAQAAPAKTAAKPMAVCVAKATGVVTARPKCKAGESPLSLTAVAASAVGPQGPAGLTGEAGPPGPQGPKGDSGTPGIINTASCYQKTGEWQLTNDGEGFADADCNNPASEFMLTSLMDYQPYVDVFTREITPTLRNGDTVPTGVSLSVFSATKVYQLRAIIVCCKR